MKEKQSMILYYDWAEDFAELSDAKVGQLINAIMKYDMTGEDTVFKDKFMRSIFRRMKNQCDANREKFEEKCKNNSINAKKRWNKNATACDRIGSHQVAFQKNANYADNDSGSGSDTDNDTDTDSGCGSGSDQDACARTDNNDNDYRGKVIAFFRNRKYQSDPETFIAYNNSRGINWKDTNGWHSKAELWEIREKGKHPPDRKAADLDGIISGRVTPGMTGGGSS